MNNRSQVLTMILAVLLVTIVALYLIISPRFTITDSDPISTTRSIATTDIAPGSVVPPRIITFSTGLSPQLDTFQASNAIYTEAFSRLGYDFELISILSSIRSIEEANNGRVDGEYGRIYSLNQKNEYPNLTRVDEPLRIVLTAAYTINPDILFTDWEDFRNTDYTFAYVRGHINLERNLAVFAPQNQVISVDNYQQMVDMLVAGRVDVILSITDFEPFIYSEENKEINILNAGYIDAKELYPYLNRNYSHLAPQLADTLRMMKEDGSYQKLLAMYQVEDIQEFR